MTSGSPKSLTGLQANVTLDLPTQKSLADPKILGQSLPGKPTLDLPCLPVICPAQGGELQQLSCTGIGPQSSE